MIEIVMISRFGMCDGCYFDLNGIVNLIYQPLIPSPMTVNMKIDSRYYVATTKA